MEDLRNRLTRLMAKLTDEELRCVCLLVTNLLKKYPDD